MKAPVATSVPRRVGCAVKQIEAYVPDPNSALYAFRDRARRRDLGTKDEGYSESDEVSCTSRKIAVRDGAVLHRHGPNPSQRKTKGSG
jgi:hypothetical protein